MKAQTRLIIGALIAAGAVLQDPTIASMLVALTATHPHIAALISIVIVLGATLHRPDVQAAIEEDAPDAAAKKEEIK